MKSLAHPPTREARGIKLFKERGDEITRVLPFVYTVPGCKGGEYLVHLKRETCTCPDYERHHAPCKHIFAATIYRARSRRRSA